MDNPSIADRIRADACAAAYVLLRQAQSSGKSSRELDDHARIVERHLAALKLRKSAAIERPRAEPYEIMGWVVEKLKDVDPASMTTAEVLELLLGTPPIVRPSR
jgi:hypothetical protein